MRGRSRASSPPAGEREDAVEREPASPRSMGRDVLALQRLAGNRAVTALLQGGTAGRALPEPLDREAAARFGPAASHARLHVDDAADRTAVALEADAFTLGSDVFVRPAAYAPASSAGRALLLHELAHVAQHYAGLLPGRTDTLERQADRAAASGMRDPSLASGAGPAPAPPTQVLRQAAPAMAGEDVEPETQPADAKKKIRKVTLYRDQDRIDLIVEGYEAQSATLLHNGKPDPGLYHAVRDSATGGFRLTPPITGTAEDGYVIRWRAKDATLEGVRAYTVEVIAGEAGTGELAAGAGTPAPQGMEAAEAGARPRSRDETWREIQQLPDHIKGFLTAERGPRLSARDYETVLAIGRRLELEGVTAEELYAYRRGASSTRSVAQFQSSIERFLDVRSAERSRRAQNVLEREQVQTRLFGLKDLYLTYRRYQQLRRGAEVGSPAAGYLNLEADRLLAELNRELPRHGFADVAEFEAHIAAFLETFQRETLALAHDLLWKYEYLLVQAQGQFANWDDREALKVLRDVGRVRGEAQELYRQAERHEVEAAVAMSGTGFRRFDPKAAQRHLGEARQARRRADEMVAEAVPRQPVVGWQDFPRERLLRQRSPADVRVLMGRYIAEHIGGVRRARELLEEKPDRVFQVNRLLEMSRRAQGVADGSIEHLIIRHRKEDIESEEFARNLLIAILTVALSVVSFGAGGVVGAVAAGAAFGLSAYQAIEEVQSYDEKTQLYVAQLLSEKPSVAWAVLAVVGAGADAAAVVKALKVVAPAAEAFESTPDLARLQDALQQVDSRIARNVEKAAQAKQEFDTAVQALTRTTGQLRVVIFPGGEEFARLVAVAYYTIKRGVVSFEKYLLELRRQGLVKSVDAFAPEELKTLKDAHHLGMGRTLSGEPFYGEQIYGRLSQGAKESLDPAAVDELVAFGRAVGASDDEIVATIESTVRARDIAETRVGLTARTTGPGTPGEELVQTGQAEARSAGEAGLRSARRRSQQVAREAGILVHKYGEDLRTVLRRPRIPRQFQGRVLPLSELPDGLLREQSLGVTSRVDRITATTIADGASGIIYEIKPSNVRAIKDGLGQVRDYVNLANATSRGGRSDWRGVVVVYNQKHARELIR